MRVDHTDKDLDRMDSTRIACDNLLKLAVKNVSPLFSMAALGDDNVVQERTANNYDGSGIDIVVHWMGLLCVRNSDSNDEQ